MTVLRSMLFAPANHARRIEKARELEVDAVVLDLEDSVAATEKQTARGRIEAYLKSRSAHGPRHYVRINGIASGLVFDDLVAVVFPGLDGVVLPKAESAAQIHIVDFALTQLERQRGLRLGSVEVLPSLETAVGVQSAQSIAQSHPRVRRLNFGAGDFSLDTGGVWDDKNAALTVARSLVLIAGRAAGLDGPIDSASPVIDDALGLAAEAGLARSMGYAGKVCIHPKQVAVINEVFSPTPDEIVLAERIVQAFEAAELAGSAAIVVDGRLVDYPIAAKARKLLEESEFLRSNTSSKGNRPAQSSGERGRHS